MHLTRERIVYRITEVFYKIIENFDMFFIHTLKVMIYEVIVMSTVRARLNRDLLNR